MSDAPTTDLKSFKYRAFISYSREDRDLVDDLYKRLTKWRAPGRLRKRQGKYGAPPRSLSVYMDRKSQQTGEILSSGLREKLERSAFLIVVCSTAGADPDSWVTREIEHFLKVASPDRIIPIIVREDANQPLGEVFPAPLLAMGEVAPIGADLLHDGGIVPVTHKIIGGLTGFSQNEIAREQELADQRGRRRAVLIAVVFFFLAAAAAVAAYIAQDRNFELNKLVKQLQSSRPLRVAVTGGEPTTNVPPTWYKIAVDAANALGRVEALEGCAAEERKPIGSGVLLDGGLLSDRWRGTTVFVTSSHVVGGASWRQCGLDQYVLRFAFAPDQTYPLGDILWTSTNRWHVTVLEMHPDAPTRLTTLSSIADQSVVKKLPTVAEFQGFVAVNNQMFREGPAIVSYSYAGGDVVNFLIGKVGAKFPVGDVTMMLGPDGTVEGDSGAPVLDVKHDSLLGFVQGFYCRISLSGTAGAESSADARSGRAPSHPREGPEIHPELARLCREHDHRVTLTASVSIHDVIDVIEKYPGGFKSDIN